MQKYARYMKPHGPIRQRGGQRALKEASTSLGRVWDKPNAPLMQSGILKTRFIKWPFEGILFQEERKGWELTWTENESLAKWVRQQIILNMLVSSKGSSKELVLETTGPLDI